MLKNHIAMKSKITIDFDLDNQPVIKIEYSASEDVRDKLVKKFLETFGGESRWCEFYYLNASKEGVNSTSLIRPISPFQTIEKSKAITYFSEKLQVGNGIKKSK